MPLTEQKSKSSTSQQTLEAISPYEAMTRKTLARILKVSEETVRHRCLRLQTKGLVELGEFPGGQHYIHITDQGLSEINSPSKRRKCSSYGLWCRLAIADACVSNNWKLLAQAQLEEVLKVFEETVGEGLHTKGLHIGRWRVVKSEDRYELSLIHVESGVLEIGKLVSKLSDRVQTLSERSAEWKLLVENFFSFTVLHYSEGLELKLKEQCEESGLKTPIHWHSVPLLSHLKLGD